MTFLKARWRVVVQLGDVELLQDSGCYISMLRSHLFAEGYGIVALIIAKVETHR